MNFFSSPCSCPLSPHVCPVPSFAPWRSCFVPLVCVLLRQLTGSCKSTALGFAHPAPHPVGLQRDFKTSTWREGLNSVLFPLWVVKSLQQPSQMLLCLAVLWWEQGREAPQGVVLALPKPQRVR